MVVLPAYCFERRCVGSGYPPVTFALVVLELPVRIWHLCLLLITLPRSFGLNLIGFPLCFSITIPSKRRGKQNYNAPATTKIVLSILFRSERKSNVIVEDDSVTLARTVTS